MDNRPAGTTRQSRWLAVVILGCCLALLASPAVSQAQTTVSTHWTGWYSVYGPCKNQAQMHWRHLSDGRNEVERHYWWGRLSSFDHASYNLRIWGRDSWYTMDVAYKFPSDGRYYGPFTFRGTCGEWANGHIDHRFRDLDPSITHDFLIRCKPGYSCGDFNQWKRIGIGNPAGTWKVLGEGGGPV